LPDVVPRDVLVAVAVNPSWIPLLPVLGAVVLDYGSPGDHAAITAREYGVPVVCSTHHATQSIPDGTWVTVDGTEGKVTLGEV
jgi:pyruvate,water dikinase